MGGDASSSHTAQNVVLATIPLVSVLLFAIYSLREQPALWTPLATLALFSTGPRPTPAPVLQAAAKLDPCPWYVAAPC